MLTRLWTTGIKVPDLDRELEFHRRIGNEIILDENIEMGGESFRLPLVKMGDKYIHLMEKTVYERQLGESLPFGICHLVYVTNSFDQDVARAVSAGAKQIGKTTQLKAGFGERRLAFLRAPGGWNFEIIEIIRNLVPEV